MPVSASYGDYIASDEYREYYQKYISQMRESDRVLIEMVREAFKERLERDETITIADIGCSTGILLHHLKHHLPGASLFGGDVYPEVIQANQANHELAGITFGVTDLLSLDQSNKFDAIIVNAVLFIFDEQEFERAVSNLARALRPQGWLFAFDFSHPYEQDLIITEKSRTHPEGMNLHFRPMSLITTILEKHGFSEVSIKPFDIPIDLQGPDDPTQNYSRTIKTEDSHRLIFRGALYTPWCHIAAQKKG